MIFNNKNVLEIRKNIALDIGNVLVYVDMDILYTELIVLGYCSSMERAQDICIPMQRYFDIGAFDFDEYFSCVLQYSSANVKILKEAWYATVRPCKETLYVLTDLLAEGCDVALLSNIGYNHADYLSDICGQQFSSCIKHFSCAVGARKPMKLFYQSFLMDYPHFSDQKIYKTDIYRSLFLDDKLENIDAANLYFDAKIFNINDYSTGHDAAEAMIKIVQNI